MKKSILTKKEAECLSECEKIATYLKRHLPSSVTILGPTASFLPKVQHAHSYQLLLKYKNSKEVRKEVTFLKKQYQKNTHVTLDIDLSL